MIRFSSNVLLFFQNSHKDEIAEKDRKTQFKLQVQMNQINSEVS